MSLWEFAACVDGWNAANGAGKSSTVTEMTDDDYQALCDLGDKWNAENDRHSSTDSSAGSVDTAA